MAATAPLQPIALPRGVKRLHPGTVANSTEENLAYSAHVRGYHVGAMTIKEFRLQYMQEVKLEKPTPDVDWSPVLKATAETKMYEPFVTAALKAGLLRENIEIFISADRNSSTSHLRPDIGIRILEDDTPSKQWKDRSHIITDPFDFATTSLAIEFKFKSDADPFKDNFQHPNWPFERNSDHGRKVRGQLAKYADGQFSHQHRCFVWQVLICGNIARIIRWDHSGALVSEAFDYIATEYLAEFLWNFYHMMPKLQGWDDSVSLVRDVAQRGLLYDAIRTLVSNNKIRQGDNLAWATIALDESFPVHKVEVKDKYTCQTYHFLLSRAFDVEVGPIGRGTRWYIAYDLKHDQLRMLKDSWRVEDASILQEMDACSLLKHIGVSNILKTTCRGDVMVFGTAQRTTVHTFATKPLPWRAPCNPVFGMFRHCRQVEDVGYPMSCLTSSRQVVVVVRDIIKAIKDAYMGSAGVLHRNVNVKNIMFIFSGDTESGIKGVLTGWDHSILVTKLNSAQSPFHSLTHQCMSIGLLEEPGKIHELQDDLESTFWSLVWFGLHHVSHSNRTILFNKDPFGPSCDTLVNGEITNRRSSGKQDLLKVNSTLRDLPFASEGYRDLLKYLLEMHDKYYRFRVSRLYGDDDLVKYQDIQRQLSDPNWWIKTLDGFLETGKWTEKDIVNDIFPPVSTTRQRGQLDALVSSRFDTSHIDKSTGRPQTTLVSSERTAVALPGPSKKLSLFNTAINKILDAAKDSSSLGPTESRSSTKSNVPVSTIQQHGQMDAPASSRSDTSHIDTSTGKPQKTVVSSETGAVALPETSTKSSLFGTAMNKSLDPAENSSSLGSSTKSRSSLSSVAVNKCLDPAEDSSLGSLKLRSPAKSGDLGVRRNQRTEDDIVNDNLLPAPMIRQRGQEDALLSSRFDTSPTSASAGRPQEALVSSETTALVLPKPSTNLSMLSTASNNSLDPAKDSSSLGSSKSRSSTKSGDPNMRRRVKKKHAKKTTENDSPVKKSQASSSARPVKRLRFK